MRNIPSEKGITPRLAAMGAAAGFVNGLLGAGGGIITVVALNKYFGENESDKNGVFATALCIMLPVSLLSCFLYASKGYISTEGFGLFIPSAILGGALGGLCLNKVNSLWLKKFFAALVALSGIFLIVR